VVNVGGGVVGHIGILCVAHIASLYFLNLERGLTNMSVSSIPILIAVGEALSYLGLADRAFKIVIQALRFYFLQILWK
jgi:hypothetical protein